MIPVTIRNPDALPAIEQRRHRAGCACKGDLSACPEYQQFMSNKKGTAAA